MIGYGRFMQTEPQRLLAEIRAFCRQTGMAESTFGMYAVHNGALVKRLAAGGDLKTATIVRVRKFIAEREALVRK